MAKTLPTWRLAARVDAYRASLRGQPAPVLDGFTGDTRCSWLGQVLARQVPAEATPRHKSRPILIRPPLPHRRPMRNIDAWYDAGA